MNVSNGLCNMCKSRRETLYHLFWECDRIKLIWKKVENDFKLFGETLKCNILRRDLNYKDIVLGLECRNGQGLINAIIFECKWQIWKARNKTN